jgi:hypothetical protein
MHAGAVVSFVDNLRCLLRIETCLLVKLLEAIAVFATIIVSRHQNISYLLDIRRVVLANRLRMVSSQQIYIGVELATVVGVLRDVN